MSVLKKDLAQALRANPSTAFNSAGSPLALVQYVSDTIPIGKSICPTVNDLERPGYQFLDDVHDEVLNLTFKEGQTVMVGFAVGGVEFGGFGLGEVDHKIVVEAETEAQLLSATVSELKRLSFISAFVKGDRFFVLDQNGDEAKVTGEIVESSIQTIRYASPIMPRGYRRGDAWKKCRYMRILDSWIDGSDDTHHNVTILLKADLTQLGADADNVDFPNDLESDGSSIDYPYFGKSEEITWEFEVANPDLYVRPPSCTPHPTNPRALLISERQTNSAAAIKISRVYREIGPISEQVKSGYEVSYEDTPKIGDDTASQFPTVRIEVDVLLESYTPPRCDSACPVVGDTSCGTNAPQLDFSSLQLIEPPVMKPVNTVYGKLAAVYGKIPGFITSERVEDSRYGQVTQFRQRVAAGADLPQKGEESAPGSGLYITDVTLTAENSCTKQVSWSVAPMPTCTREGSEFNSETGVLDPFSEIIIPTSQVPDTLRALSSGGDVISVTARDGTPPVFNGDYNRTIIGLWTFSRIDSVFYRWGGSSWTLSTPGEPDQIGVGGDISSPITAEWENYTIAEVPGSPIGGLNASGFYATHTPIDCFFSTVRMRKASPFVTRTYETHQNYSWPAVVQEVELMDWDRRDGGTEIRPLVRWLRYAYSGPTRARIVDTWSRTPMTLDTVQIMRPVPVSYSCPAYSISIPASLHPDLSFRCDFGNNHSVYENNVGSERIFLATQEVDWPASLVASSVQSPHRGGYLRRTITVFPPILPF